jgi:hypothetical protein
MGWRIMELWRQQLSEVAARGCFPRSEHYPAVQVNWGSLNLMPEQRPGAKPAHRPKDLIFGAHDRHGSASAASCART